MRSRVDVVARYHRSADISSLTVLTVSGFGAAGRLVRVVADEREHATTPFDPHRPDFAVTLARFGGRGERHEPEPVAVVPDGEEFLATFDRDRLTSSPRADGPAAPTGDRLSGPCCTNVGEHRGSGGALRGHDRAAPDVDRLVETLREWTGVDDRQD
ncbi:hypothetical protein [Saccharomonospora cyanea]|uniref:hypothetical protein n=1 Tax=Saccharomonospora cyanea TaxID=40989 RepID=UPI0002DCD22F|nr:hypothetical protein [Saccharomonospora cyanea]